MSVITTYFNNTTLAERKSNGLTFFCSHKRTNYPAGTLVAVYNLETRTLVGVARLRNWDETGTPCTLHHLLDIDTHTGPHSNKNKYEIGIEKLRWLESPISYEEIRKLVGGEKVPDATQTNIWKGFHTSFCRAFLMNDDASILERYTLFIKSLL